MPIMNGITNPKEALISEELNSDYFEIAAGQVQPKQGVVVTTTDAVDYVVARGDRYIVVDAGTTLTKNVVFPAAAAFPNRLITVRGPVTFAGRIVTVKTAAGSELTAPGGQPNATRVTWPFIQMNDRAVVEATWLSAGSLWKLVNWTERKFYTTGNYSPPAGAATFNGTGGVAPAAGQPYQIPAGYTAWTVADGNYTPYAKLPLANTTTGRFSFYAANSAGFESTIAKEGTDLPADAWIQSPSQSMHFEWSNGLWRWRPSPEPAYPAPALSPVVGSGAAATRSFGGVPLTPVTSALGTLIGFMFPPV
jgi:hypothetical protein